MEVVHLKQAVGMNRNKNEKTAITANLQKLLLTLNYWSWDFFFIFFIVMNCFLWRNFSTVRENISEENKCHRIADNVKQMVLVYWNKARNGICAVSGEKKKLLYALTLMRRVEHLRRIFRITKFKAPEMAADLPRNSVAGRRAVCYRMKK